MKGKGSLSPSSKIARRVSDLDVARPDVDHALPQAAHRIGDVAVEQGQPHEADRDREQRGDGPPASAEQVPQRHQDCLQRCSMTCSPISAAGIPTASADGPHAGKKAATAADNRDGDEVQPDLPASAAIFTASDGLSRRRQREALRARLMSSEIPKPSSDPQRRPDDPQETALEHHEEQDAPLFRVPMARSVPHSLIRSKTILFIVLPRMKRVTRQDDRADHPEETAEHRVDLHVVGREVVPGAIPQTAGGSCAAIDRRPDVPSEHVHHGGAAIAREVDRRVVVGEGEDLVPPGIRRSQSP